MNLLIEYKKYVQWCEQSSVNPIGFIRWKGIKFNAAFNEKTLVWTYNE